MDRQLTDQELATVLAALRYWQRHIGIDLEGMWPHMVVATDDGMFVPLGFEGIDKLCEELTDG